MKWLCPTCGSDFGEDSISFVAHMRTCKSKPLPEQDQTRTDDPRIADTPYEKRRFREDVIRRGLPDAAQRHSARTAYKSNPYEEKARQKKVHAVAEHIDCRACEAKLNPFDREVAQGIVEQLTHATEERWASLASEAKVTPLSGESRTALIVLFRERVTRAADQDAAAC